MPKVAKYFQSVFKNAISKEYCLLGRSSALHLPSRFKERAKIRARLLQIEIKK
jgi:hypothetical protein